MSKSFDKVAFKAGAIAIIKTPGENREVRFLYEKANGTFLALDHNENTWLLNKDGNPNLVCGQTIMAPIKQTRQIWVNVYDDCEYMHSRESEAVKYRNLGTKKALATVPVLLEWEE